MKETHYTTLAAASALAGLLCSTAIAHSPICKCYENGDETVTCEGGFSDGSSAEGISIRVLDDRERVLIDGKMDADSTFSFARPEQAFHVVFDAGQSHVVTIFGEDIE